MLYKLYKNTFSRSPPPERRALFSKLYRKYGVELLGVWKNKDNPLEYYMLTKYRDEAHYLDFVNQVKQMPEYVQMTRKVDEVRISASVIDLIEG